MTRFAAISTFNEAGLKLYGWRFVETFLRNWPEDVSLRLYSEGWAEGELAAHSGHLAVNGRDVGIVDLATASPWLSDFKSRNAHRTFKTYRWDAVRFAHKVAAVCHAARDLDADMLIWLDADIVTHAPLTVENLELLGPRPGEWIAWLNRKSLYPECGFYMLNCNHSRHGDMIEALEAMYTEGHLYGLSEFHDSYVLQHVVDTAGVSWRSLSGDFAGHSHPLVNGPLGAWFDHLKGPRKREGKSRRGDLKAKRNEDYWT